MHIFRDLRHIAAIRSLVKNNVDPVQGSRNSIAIPHVALDEFRFWIYPCWFSAPMCLRLQIIQSAHLPTFAHEKVYNVGTNQTCGASDECTFHHFILPCRVRRASPTTKSPCRRA